MSRTLAFRDQLRSGRASCRRELEFLLAERQRRWDLNAFLSSDSEALADEGVLSDAERLDEEISCGLFRPLTGWMIAVKDNIAVAGRPLTCASRILAPFTALTDATVVSRLRAAGALVIGRTNLDEFAMGSSTEHSAFGRVRHPLDPELVPGGSSGGSAVAVAAGLAHAALGSDTGGSIRQPASFCGVVGLKPTYGRVSRSGLVAFASSFDQIGSFAPTVAEAAQVLEVLMGPDPLDATTVDAPVPALSSEFEGPIAGLRVGIPDEYHGEGIQTEVEEALLRAIEEFRARGAMTCTLSLPHTRYTIPAYQILTTAEASSNLARYDGMRYGQRGSRIDTVEDLLVSSRSEGLGAEVQRRIMLGTYVLSAGYYDAYTRKAQQVRRLIREDFLRAFQEVDVLLTPTTPTTAFRAGEKSKDPLAMYLSDILTASANLAGLPASSVPAGTDRQGRPIGLQILAPPLREDLLVRASAAVESFFSANT